VSSSKKESERIDAQEAGDLSIIGEREKKLQLERYETEKKTDLKRTILGQNTYLFA